MTDNSRSAIEPEDTSDDVVRLRSLSRALDSATANPVDPATIRPVIRPFDLGQLTPSYQLPCGDLYVLWVSATESEVKGYVNEIYVTRERQSQLEVSGVSLPRLAMRNIAEVSGLNLATQGFGDQAGTLIGMYFFQEDGYGPARTFFSGYLSRYFPTGYWLAYPTRTEAIVLSKTAPENELTRYREAVEHIYDQGQGVCRRLLDPDEVAVPDDWLADATAYLNELAAKS